MVPGANQPETNKATRMAKLFLLMDQLSAMRRGPGAYEEQKGKLMAKDDMCLIHYGK